MSYAEEIDAEAPTTLALRLVQLPLVLVSAVVMVLVVAVIVVKLVRSGPDPLRGDPNGAAACRGLADWISGQAKDPRTGEPYTKLRMSVTLAGKAAQSTTPDIRDTATDVLDDPRDYGTSATTYSLNLQELWGACAAAGETMPAYAEPARG